MASQIQANIDSYDAMVCPNISIMVNCSSVTPCEKRELSINMYVPMFMMLSGIVGNMAALFVLFTLSKNVRKTVYYPLLTGLAWTDLIGQVVTSPVTLLSYSKKVELTGTLCMFNGFVMVFFGLITPLLICVLSIERLLSLKFTYYYHRLVTARKAKLTILMCWLIVMIFCSFPMMGFGRYSLQFPCTWCFLKFHRAPGSSVSVYAILFGFLNLLLIAIMLVCNLIVVSTLLRMRRQRKINSSPSSSIKKIAPSTPPPPLPPSSPSVISTKLKIEMEIKMVWFLSCITVVFLVCWVPFNVNILQSQLSGKINHARDLITVRLVSVNQIIDPWLYILLRGNLFWKLFNYLKGLIPFKGKRMQQVDCKGIKINFPKENGELKKRSLKNGKEESHYKLPVPKEEEPEEMGPCVLHEEQRADELVAHGDNNDNKKNHNNNNNNNNNPPPRTHTNFREQTKFVQTVSKSPINSAESCFEHASSKWRLSPASEGKYSLPGEEPMDSHETNGLRTCPTFPFLTAIERGEFESEHFTKYSNDSSV